MPIFYSSRYIKRNKRVLVTALLIILAIEFIYFKEHSKNKIKDDEKILSSINKRLQSIADEKEKMKKQNQISNLEESSEIVQHSTSSKWINQTLSNGQTIYLYSAYMVKNDELWNDNQ